MLLNHKLKIFLAISILSFLILPHIASAITFPSFIPECALGELNTARNIYVQKATPDLNCVQQILINIARMILMISGVIALGMFIYGGILWMTAAGKPEKVKKGTQIMVGTVIGLIIIFSANLAISTVEKVIKGQFKPGATTEETP